MATDPEPPRAQAPDAGVTLFIDPVTYHFEGDRLFDLETSNRGGDNVLEPYLYMRRWLGERGVRVHTADLLMRGEALSERNLYVSLGIRHRYGELAERDDVTLSAFVAMECPIVAPSLYLDMDEASSAFERMYSFSTPDALQPFLKAPLDLRQFQIPQSFERVHEEIWAGTDRELLVMINANKVPPLQTNELYTERMRAVEFFARTGEIDLYGMGWDGPAYRVGDSGVPPPLRRAEHRLRGWRQKLRPDPLLEAARQVYRGPCASKAQTLGRYRFAACFENMVLEGWITEKLFDCLFTGTVPIYLGAPDITDWVPPECFIDMRRFDGYPELREFLLSLGDTEVQSYRDAARDFLASERFLPFGKQAHAELFGRIVEEDAGLPLGALVPRPAPAPSRR